MINFKYDRFLVEKLLFEFNKEKLVKERLDISIILSNNCGFISGDFLVIEEFKKILKMLKIPCFVNNKNYGFHHKSLAEIETRFKRNLKNIEFMDPKIKIISNYNNEVYRRENLKELMSKQIYNCVNFQKNIDKVKNEVDVFIDVF